MLGLFIFCLVRFRLLHPTKTPDLWKQTKNFLTMRSKDSETTHFHGSGPGVASQQRLCPRRFDSTVKRVPKLRFESVSFLFLVCFSKRTIPNVITLQKWNSFLKWNNYIRKYISDSKKSGQILNPAPSRIRVMKNLKKKNPGRLPPSSLENKQKILRK